MMPQSDRVPLVPYLLGQCVQTTAPCWVKLAHLETRLLRRRLLPVDRPIYVMGLLRSGTTITLELISGHPDVAAHRHVDLPNPYTPWLWNGLVSRLGFENEQPVERLHKDALMVTSLSPEAGEEVLWMRFLSGLHEDHRSAVLRAEDSHPAFEAFYRDTIAKMLYARGRRRYVAKGNYNITRLGFLRRLFPDARFVLLVRHPYHQIASLMKQDKLFTQLIAADPRWVHMMSNIGHFQFGPYKRWINLGDDARVEKVRRLMQEGRPVRAWGVYWASIYAFLAEQLATDPQVAESTLLLRYEDLCDHAGPTIDRILAHTGLDAHRFAAVREQFLTKLKAPDYYRPTFSAAERSDLIETTAEIAARFGYPRSSFEALDS